MEESTQDLPKWIDNAFFATILKEKISKQVAILSFKVFPAVPSGNNFSCAVYRVKIEYEADSELAEASLIIKTSLPDGKAKDMVTEMGMVEKECAIFKELLPLYDKVLSKRITPRNYSCSIPETLILEDLKEQGYMMCDRLAQLDFDHCNIFMKTIAAFHAASVHIHKHNPELIKRVGKECLLREVNNDGFKQYFIDSCSKLAAVLEEWGDFDHFVDLYRNNIDKLFDKLLAIHSGKKHLRVLNHGDSWTNNLMFKYDKTGKVIDLILIDLQMCKFASPAIDLINFIVSSALQDVKDDRLPELYNTYLKQFNRTLESIGDDERLTAEELQDELTFASCLPLYSLPIDICLILAERDNVMNMDQVMDAVQGENENNVMCKALKGEKFKQVTQYTLRKLEQQNILSTFL